MSRLLWPELEPEAAAEGWLADPGIGVTSGQMLDALARRHSNGPSWNGMPGRWVFVTEVQEATGAYGEAQRFDAVAVGLVPSVDYARIIYEVKISRGDWLRELRPTATIRDKWGVERLRGKRAAAVLTNIGDMPEWDVTETHKWDVALALSTEFWVAAPPRVVQPSELPPEAGLIEVRPWGPERELRARVVVRAPRRKTAHPGPEFWAAVLRRAAGQRPIPSEKPA